MNELLLKEFKFKLNEDHDLKGSLIVESDFKVISHLQTVIYLNGYYGESLDCCLFKFSAGYVITLSHMIEDLEKRIVYCTNECLNHFKEIIFMMIDYLFEDSSSTYVCEPTYTIVG